MRKLIVVVALTAAAIALGAGPAAADVVSTLRGQKWI